MIGGALWSLVSAAVLAQSGAAVQRIRILASTATDTVVAAQVGEWPDEAREAFRGLLIDATLALPQQALHLRSAERLAVALAAAWRDSFLLRRVAVFRSWPPARRRQYIVADSVRRAGNAVVYREGVGAAMSRWRESLRLFAALEDSAGQAAVLGNLGAGFYMSGAPDSATRYLEQARRLAAEVGDLLVAGNALMNLGSLARDRGDPRGASESYTRALELYQRAGNHRGVATAYNNLGLIAKDLGDLAGARQAYEAALALNRRHHDLSGAADNLVNLGGLAIIQGDYAAAQARYEEALATYRELDEPVNAALALYNLGLLQVRRGDYRRATASLGEALAVYRATGHTLEAISARRALAGAHAAMGDLQAALDELSLANDAAAAEPSAGTATQAALALARGDLATHLNLFADAEREYARAARLYREAADPAGRAEAEQGRGVLHLLREDFAAASRVLGLALRAQEAADPRSAAWSRVLLASARAGLGDTAAARRSLQQAIGAFHRLGDRVSEAAALGSLADLQRTKGLTLAAESLYQRALGLVADRPAPTVSWRLRAGLAQALASRGDVVEAARQLRLAIADAERVSANLRAEQRRASFLADKWDVYEQLVLLEVTRERDAAAFEVSERMRARQMLDLLARGRVEDATGPAREVTAREQDLRRRIAELTTDLEESGWASALRGPGEATRSSGTLREALASAQQEYANLLLDVRERAPQYATILAGEPVPPRDIMARLTPGQAILEYLLGDSTSVVFVVTPDTVAALDLGVGRKAIARLVDFARGTVLPPQGSGSPERWHAPLRRLYMQLVQPIEATGLLRGARQLLIAPHAELHYLPFDALITSERPRRFLIERYDVAHVPSASVWTRLASRTTGRETERVLALAPRDRTLPGSREEVAAIGEIFGDRATVLIGDRATEQVLFRDGARYGVIHLATYGVLNKHNPLFSFVELSPDSGGDGRLEVHEVFGINLSARLVVLSACQTALGSGALADVPNGDDWVGLVRAFLHAGAANVLATSWPVEDRRTAVLMERFYRHLASGTPLVEALSRAKRASLADPNTSDPFYWAGFVLVGSL